MRDCQTPLINDGSCCPTCLPRTERRVAAQADWFWTQVERGICPTCQTARADREPTCRRCGFYWIDPFTGLDDVLRPSKRTPLVLPPRTVTP